MSSTASAPAPHPLASCPPVPEALGAVFAKELRQGLRARRFAVPFLVIQIFAVVAVGSELGLSSLGPAAGAIFGSLVLLVVVAGVAVVMPLTQIAALTPELGQGRNVELLLMSNLDRWQIVRGKWLVGFTLSALMLVSLLPHLLARYFLGGQDLLATLSLVAGLVLANAAFTALAIGASGYQNLLARFLVMGTGVFSAWFTLLGAGWLFFSRTGSAAGASRLWQGLASLGVASVVAALYVAYGLQLGRARLRPYEDPLDPPASGLVIAMMFFTPVVTGVAAGATMGYGGWAAAAGLLALALSIDRSPGGTRSLRPYAQP